MKKQLLALFILILTSCFLYYLFKPGNLTIHSLFTDHMVMQQDTTVAIWGTYIPSEKVTVAGNWGNKTTTIADEQGNWMLNLVTPVAGGPYKLIVSTNENNIELEDIMIGESAAIPSFAG